VLTKAQNSQGENPQRGLKLVRHAHSPTTPLFPPLHTPTRLISPTHTYAQGQTIFGGRDTRQGATREDGK
jgi:hypothetical protein